MAGVNNVTIVGNLGKDPELKHSSAGKAYCHMSVATSETWKDQAGEKKERTDWHFVMCHGQKAEFISKYARKGDIVSVIGRLQYSKIRDADGRDKDLCTINAETVTIVHHKAPRDANDSSAPAPAARQKSQEDFVYDEVPF
jgi:single-strand DNA-binding protein